MDSLKIGVEVEFDQKGLKDADKSVKEFASNAGKGLEKGADGAKELSTEITKSGKAVQFLDSKSQGAASALIDVANAAKLTGKEMKAALLASGIGAAVVLLGIVVSHWDEIKEAIGTASTRLQKHIDLLKNNSEVLNRALDLNEAQNELLKLEGKFLGKNREQRLKILGSLKQTNTQQIASLKTKLASVKAAALELSLFERLKVLTGTGLRKGSISKSEAEEINKLQEAIDDLEKSLVNIDIDVFKTNNPKVDKINNKDKVSALTGLPTADAFFEYSQTAKKAYANIIKELGGLSETAEIIKPLPPLVNPLSLSFDELTYLAHVERMKEILKNFNEETDALIEGSTADAFSGIGQAIGNALATGGNVLKSAGKALLGTLGSFLSELGGLLIKYGLLAIAKGKLDVAIAAGGPVAIVAGGAAVAVGILAKAAGAAIGALSSKGSSGSSSGSSFSSSSSSGNSFQGSTVRTATVDSGFKNVVFVLKGQDLYGSVSNYLSRNNNLGGSLG